LRPGADSLKGPASPAAPYRVMDMAESVPESRTHQQADGKSHHSSHRLYVCLYHPHEL
jgi:hypothetical protein